MKKCNNCKIELEDEVTALEVHGNITNCPECNEQLIES